MIYLLDTNVCVDYMRGRVPGVRHSIDAVPPQAIALCSVVRAELFRGIYRSASPLREQARVVAFAQRFASLPFDDPAAEIAGRLDADLQAMGLRIGPYDLHIAAIALAHGLTLVTRNTQEFSRVMGLALEDWHTTP